MANLSENHEKFLDDLKDKGRSPATIIAYGKDIEQVIEFLKKREKESADEVTREDLVDFIKSLEEKDYTPKSISRKINAVRTFFKFLLLSDAVSEDPSTTLEHPKITIQPPRILSQMEYRALRDACREDIRTSAVVELLLQTGIRIGELRRAKTEGVVFGETGQEGSIEIASWGKTPKRTIPLNQTAQKALKRYLDGRPSSRDGTLFVTKSGRPLLIRNIRTTINRYFKRGGIKNAKVNDIRHTFVATHLTRGVPITTVSKLAGHLRLTTTEKYLEHIDKPAEEKIDLEEL